MKRLLVLSLLLVSSGFSATFFRTGGGGGGGGAVATSTIQSDLDDIVFTASDGLTLLSFYPETKTTSGTATFWAKCPTLSTGANSFYIYYNNPSAVNSSTFSTTFTKDYYEQGTAGLWHLDDGVSPTADSSGNANNGTLYGGVAWQTTDGGQWDGQNVQFTTGKHLLFDGINDYVDCGNSASLESNTLTISAWAKPVDTTARAIVAKYASASPNYGYALQVNVQAVNQINGWFGSTWVSGAFTWDSNWHLLTTTYDGTTGRVYVDGVEKGSGVVGRNQSTASLGIGALIGAGYYFNNAIDEVRIYNRVLTANEIKALYYRRKYTSNTITVSYGTEEVSSVLSGYSYRRPLTISNSGSALDNFQVEIPIRITATFTIGN